MSNYAGFNSVKLQRPQRSSFDLSHQKRLTCRMGKLVPILMMECIPSDTVRGSSEVLLRLAPLLAPIYDSIELYVHFFFVPLRILWVDFEEFITGGRLGVGIDPVAAPIPPYLDLEACLGEQPAQWGKGGLPDYLGVPLLLENDPDINNWIGKTIDLMPFAAYQRCWYEYYRDRNFDTDANVVGEPVASGLNEEEDDFAELRTRNYMHDYFTSALPFTQRGEEVLMPVSLGGIAPLYAAPVSPPVTDPIVLFGEEDSINTGYNVQTGSVPPAANAGDLYVRGEDFDGTSTSINDFRSAYALQVWLERNAVGGSRYNESTQAHFGVKPEDGRLQRPEYLGGGRIPVRISEVVSTAWSNDGSSTVPLANMAGHGVTYGNTNHFSYFAPEHGFVVGIMSIMNPPSYMDGMPRMFRRKTFLDYPWPTFAKLGEQEVHKYELFTDGASLEEDADGDLPLFGYQSRYADWKFIPNSNHGDFRDTLLFWTLTRKFDGPVTLGSQFVRFDDETQDRIFAVGGPEVDNFWVYVNNRITVKRPLPYFGTPNTLGFGS